MNIKLVRFLFPMLGLLVFCAALWVLHHELKQYHYHDIVKELHTIPRVSLLLAVLFTVANYLVLCVYEILGFSYIRNPLPWPKIAYASFIAFSFSNNVGFYSLSGSAVRFRLYSAWGLSTLDITKLVAFCSMITFFLGLFSICSLTFLIDPLPAPRMFHLPFDSLRFLGGLFALIVIAYLVWSVKRKEPMRIKNWEFEFPSIRISLSLIITACIDWILFGAVLYVLLPVQHTVSFPGFMGYFLLAQLAGLVSHVPGGIGVFETIFLLLYPEGATPSVFGALLIFRGIYYVLPLSIAAVSVGGYELFQRRKQITGIAQIVSRWGMGVVPYVVAAMTFIAGVILLFSGATPTLHSRVTVLMDFIPLPVLEISHFLGSIAGVVLLILSWGLFRRQDGAYHSALYMYAAGILFSLLKGLDYEEALILAIMLGILLPCKEHFYRKTSLIHDRFTPVWAVFILLALICSTWLGFFSYKHVTYSHELWWNFSFHGNASRFLRAAVGIVVVVFGFSVRRLLAPAKQQVFIPEQEEIEKVRRILDAAKTTSTQLALLGDKSFLFSEQRDAFIMYGIEGRSWVAMGDPVGNANSIMPLIWEFRERCDRQDGWPVFYEVGRENLHCYLDIGLTLLKMGEEGMVDLHAFQLEGGSKKSLRHTSHKLEKEGYIFEVIPQERVSAILGTLKVISDAWLLEKNTREKKFSLGFFDENYISRYPVGVVRKENEILAFANVWLTKTKDEISIDLMRYLPAAPQGIMDYLFVNLIQWAKREGFRWFNLGMAPFSGMEARALAPVWNKLGALLFNYGENFYNFQGVRAYKEKFDPVWEPKYIALPGGFSLPWILRNVSSLISGGFKGVFTK